MAGFADTYLGQLRALVGSRLLLVPGARIVIENEAAQVLLQQRSDFGLWGLPGGNAEAGETLEAVVAREVAEETGLIVSDAKPFAFACDPAYETITFPNGDECQFFVLVFYTRAFRGRARIADAESLAVGWFALDGLPEMHPNMARSVEAYRRFKATGEFQLI